MKKRNLYYAQLGKAISLANLGVFEYKRISLILFDNIIENLLASSVSLALYHKLLKNELNKNKFIKITKNLKWFGKITEQATKLDIISDKEVLVINFCHSSRNKLYHKLFEDEKTTESCILYYCEFIEKYFLKLINNGIIELSSEHFTSTEAIQKEEDVIKLEDIIVKIKTYLSAASSKPQELLSHILLGYIDLFESTYQSDAQESWGKFNKIVNTNYHNYESIKEIYNAPLRHKYINKWFDLNNTKFLQLKQDIYNISSINVETSFEKYITLQQKIEPIYIGIVVYYSRIEGIE